MNQNKPWEFRYSLPQQPEGEAATLSLEAAEQLLLKKIEEQQNRPEQALWELARFYSQTRQHEKALERLRQILLLLPDTERRAACILAMGQTMERVGDYSAAVRYYQEAFAMKPEATQTWYFINNNLGYSLNTLGQFAEGETYCRAAIAIDPQRHNAHKNLGIALAGRGHFTEAARCFIQATKLNASDPRSLGHLQELLSQHPEYKEAFEAQLEHCRQAVQLARKAVEHAAAGRRLRVLIGSTPELYDQFLGPIIYQTFSTWAAVSMRHADRRQDLITQACTNPFDLIVLVPEDFLKEADSSANERRCSDGIRAVRHIKGNSSAPLLLLLTPSELEERGQAFRKAGADYILKVPCSPEVFRGSLLSVVPPPLRPQAPEYSASVDLLVSLRPSMPKPGNKMPVFVAILYGGQNALN